MSAGIDYGMGLTNIDKETGIRFGAISMNSVGDLWSEQAEPDFGFPMCPECEYEFEEGIEAHIPEDEDFIVCPRCDHHIFEDESDLYREDPLGWSYSEDGHLITYSESLNCLIVEKSPYYTFADFCSPCVPGAGDLDSPNPDGVKTYCLGIDWFENLRPPYVLYRVDTGEEVEYVLTVEKRIFLPSGRVHYEARVNDEYLASEEDLGELARRLKESGWDWNGEVKES